MGVEADLEEMKVLCGYDEKSGTTILGMQAAVEAKGLSAVGMKISADELIAPKTYAIAHLWDNHFVLVEPGESGQVVVTNPPGDPKSVALEDLKKAYSGFALLIAKNASELPKPRPEGPDIRFSGYSWEFGSVYEGNVEQYSFKCRNVGNDDLVISKVESTCSCLTPLVSSLTVPPGGEGEIKVALDTGGQRQTVMRNLYVTSNDPISPVVPLDVAGYVKLPRLRVSPTSVDFGQPKRSQSARQQVYIPSAPEETIEVKAVTCDLPFVTVTLSDSDKDYLPGKLVMLTLKPNAPLGVIKGKLTIETDHPKEPKAELPVVATIKGDLDTDRRSFFLGMVKKGSSAKSALTLRTAGIDPLKVDKIDCPVGCVKLDVSPKTEGKEYVLTATLSADAPVGYIKDEVTIHTNNPDQPEIKVPLYALVSD